LDELRAGNFLGAVEILWEERTDLFVGGYYDEGDEDCEAEEGCCEIHFGDYSSCCPTR